MVDSSEVGHRKLNWFGLVINSLDVYRNRIMCDTGCSFEHLLDANKCMIIFLFFISEVEVNAILMKKKINRQHP